MVDEPEVIRQEMEQTRAALAEKLDALGQRAADTVQATTETVSETVENVTGSVQETVAAVSDTVQGTVETVKGAFDLPGWIEQYPWMAVGGAAAVGFLVGRAFAPMLPSSSSSVDWGRMNEHQLPRQTSNGSHGDSHSETEAKDESSSQETGWMEGLAEKFGPEIDQFKGLALGTTMGIVREMITRGETGDLGSKISEVINQITEKLGGTPIGLTSKRDASSEQPKTERKEERKEPVGARNGGRREERGESRKAETTPWDRRRS